MRKRKEKEVEIVLKVLRSDKHSVLYEYFTGKKDICETAEASGDAVFFIDYDGSTFGHILNFLRKDGSFFMPDCLQEREKVMRCAKHFHIKDLLDTFDLGGGLFEIQVPQKLQLLARMNYRRISMKDENLLNARNCMRRFIVDAANQGSQGLNITYRIFDRMIQLIPFGGVYSHRYTGKTMIIHKDGSPCGSEGKAFIECFVKQKWMELYRHLFYEGFNINIESVYAAENDDVLAAIKMSIDLWNPHDGSKTEKQLQKDLSF